ncbi:MAG: ABC transporter ATP-binding protein [Treponema sp.]|nr:ABC transporter ATP-binding protein [Treponema sp.]
MPPKKGFQKPKNAKGTIKRIIKYMGKYKVLWPVVFICVLINSLTGVIGAYLIKPALNNYIIPMIGSQNPDFSNFARLLIMVLAMFLLGVIASYCNSRLMLYISTNLLYNIRCDLFEHLEKLPVKFYDTRTHGELMSRFTNDTDTLREMMSQTIPQLFSSSLTVISVFVMMIILSPMLTLVMIVTMLLITRLLVVIGKHSANAFRQNQICVGKLNGFVEEMIEGQKVIKVFNHEAHAKTEFNALADSLRKAGTSAMTFGGLMWPIMGNSAHIQYAIVAMVAAAVGITQKSGAVPVNFLIGTLNIGTIAAFLQYTRSFSQPISMMSQQATSILNALAGAERIFAIIDENPEIDEGKYTLVNAYEAKEGGKKTLVQSFANTGSWAWKNPEDGSLKKLNGEVIFDHVSFSYVPEKEVLRDINIHAKPGQKIALVGSTGSGKTTTINLLTRFYDVEQGKGQITYDGIPINQISKDALRCSLGMVQQVTHLFTGTIRENIRYGNLNASDSQVYEAAKLANADHFIRHLENGYDTVITGDGASLSQGQRQLLAIARAAIADPPVLILDEATSSIDTRTEALIEKGMDSLMSGRTTFVIAHRLSTVRNADEIIVLEHGKIIERGTHDQLIAAKGRYYFLYTGNRITLDE